MTLKAPTMNSGVAFYHSLWVGARWYNMPLKHWHRHSASLEAEEIHKAANNFKEGTSYEKAPFSWLVSAKKGDIPFSAQPSREYGMPFLISETTTQLERVDKLEARDQHQPYWWLRQVSWACRQGIAGAWYRSLHSTRTPILSTSYLHLAMHFSQGI